MISSQTSKAAFTLSTTNEVLNFAFTILAAEDIAVVQTSAGVDTALVKDTNYTVNVSAQKITMIGGTASDTITVYRNTPLTQTTSPAFNSQFASASYEASLDRMSIQIQGLKLGLDRSMRAPATNGAMSELALNSRISKILGFDASGNPTYYSPDIPVVPSDLVLEVASIAEMTALSVASLNGRHVSVLGYYLAGDGGGGLFYFNSGSGATPDGGLVIAPDTGSGKWLRNLANANTMNVRQFGAKGDGTTNDITAINKAVAGLPASHGHLFFPAGKYKIGSGITQLDGKSFLTINGVGAEIYNTYHGNTIVLGETSSTVNIDSLWFTGNASVRASGIHIRCHADDVNITNCYFQGCSDFGVFIGHDTSVGRCSRVNVEGNIFSGTLGDGVHASNVQDVVIADNIFYSTGDDSIAVVGESATAYPVRVVVTGNLITAAGARGIAVLEALEVLVSDNHIYTSQLAAIHVGRYLSTVFINNRVNIENNKVYYSTNAGAGPRAAIWMEWTFGCSVRGNNIADTQNGAGICFLDAEVLVIADNFIRNCPSRGIITDDVTTANVQTNWGEIIICNNHLDYIQANEPIYIVPATGKNIDNLIISGNTGFTLAHANFIYYVRITTGRVVNNTNVQSKAYTAGASVSGVTAANNN